MKPGVYSDISNDNYHGGPGISKSGLDLISRSPMHYKAAQEAEHGEDSHAFMFGTAVHALLLEPAEFVKTYTLGLRMQDVPDAIDDREVLVAMVQELNTKRMPKLSTTGTKDELVSRIEAEIAAGSFAGLVASPLSDLKGAELKALIVAENELRPGFLSISGSRHELADILRANGKPVTLWSDVKAEWERNNSHRIVLTGEDWKRAHAMRDAVEAHPAASKLLAAPGVSEESVYWIDPVTGELCRCRSDRRRNDGIFIDVKTCEDASPKGFAKSIATWRYHVQHPYYLDGFNLMREQARRMDLAEAKAFVFIAIEKKAPHAVGVYVLDEESTEIGRTEYRANLEMYAECKRTNVWPGYAERIESISLPRWALAQAA